MLVQTRVNQTVSAPIRQGLVPGKPRGKRLRPFSPLLSCNMLWPGETLEAPGPREHPSPPSAPEGVPCQPPQGTLLPLPAASESKPCEKLRESEDMPWWHSHDTRTDGRLLRNKMWAQKTDPGFEVHIHGAAFKSSEEPRLQHDLLSGVLIYVSSEGAVYLANEDSPSPTPASSHL